MKHNGHSSVLTAFAVTAVLLLLSCGRDGPLPPEDNTPPAVESSVPAQGAVSVVPTSVLAVSFTEPVVPGTIVFSLSSGSATVPCALSASGATAVCTPLQPLAFETLYTATVAAGVTDLVGNAMPQDHVWSFVTGTGADTVPPSVVAVVPAIGSININARPLISITFTEALDPATITFLLSAGTSTATCPLLYSGVTATCMPTVALKTNTLYTARVRRGVEDLAGNAMPADYFWSFKTK